MGNTSDFMFEVETEGDKEDVEDWTYEFSSLKDEIKREIEEEEQNEPKQFEQSTFEFDFTKSFESEDHHIHEDEVNINDAFDSETDSRKARLAQNVLKEKNCLQRKSLKCQQRSSKKDWMFLHMSVRR